MHAASRLFSLAIILAVTVGLASAQEYDKAFYGRWNLNIAESKLGGGSVHLKMSSIVAGPEGWVT
jgi:hypothetical protein